jgi:hypothetical protein
MRLWDFIRVMKLFSRGRNDHFYLISDQIVDHCSKIDQKYNLQDYLKPTKPKNKNDCLLLNREIRALKSAHF